MGVSTIAWVLWTALAGPGSPQPIRLEGTGAAGDDGTLRVTVSLDTATQTPGEAARIRGNSEVIGERPYRFPQGYHQPLAFLYLRLPSGKVIMYPEKGVSPRACRALEANDYRNSSLFKKGVGGLILNHDIPLIRNSPYWLDPCTYEPVRANLRTEGVYEAWIKFSIPKVKDALADAWHGTVETAKIRFRVRELPVAQRRAEPTAEQIAHVDAYMKYMDDVLSGRKVEEPDLKVTQMPAWRSIDHRLQWALEKTENEGFARYLVALLRKHRPAVKDQPYPSWWANINFYVYHCRAYSEGGYQGGSLKIIGPYLDDYAALTDDELERRLAGDVERDAMRRMGMLLDYLELKETPLRGRLETLARRHARIPQGAKPGDRELRGRLDIAWTLLYGLDILRDGMLLAQAKDLLGDPTYRKDDLVIWNYGTGSRRRELGIEGRMVLEGNRETIVFTNRNHLRR